MPGKVDYGSLEDQKGEGFDEKDMYYVKETLTREQKMRKLVLIAVPILAAVLIIGGAALFLLHDFDNLYPGKGGGKEPSYKSKSHTTINEKPDSSSTPAVPMPAPAPLKRSDFDSGEKGDNVASACVAHDKCKANGLTGECCPSLDGVFLGCCS